jgi:DNA-binding NarL/FixJ family response regulator
MWNADAKSFDLQPAPSGRGERISVALIDRRVLDRECLARGLQACRTDLDILPFSSVEDWRGARAFHGEVSTILLSIGGQRPDETTVEAALYSLSREFPSIPTVILADSDEALNVVLALDRGARGYIPTSVGLQVAVEAVNLARAGGIFIPANSLMASRDDILALDTTEPPADPLAELLSPRQAAVAQAILRGKANKIIAYELDLRESTIKVHIRCIMQKLGAHNRTEVAYRLNQLIQAAGRPARPRDAVNEPAASPETVRRIEAPSASQRHGAPLPMIVCS